MEALNRVLRSLDKYWSIVTGAVIIDRKDLQVVFYSAGAMVLVALGRGLFNFGQSFWAEKVSQRVADDLRNKIFDPLENLSFSYHDRAQTSQLRL